MTRSIAQIGLQSVAAAIATARIAVSSSAGELTTWRRAAARQRADAGHTFVFGLSDGRVIDGSRSRNSARFLNHACAPNCEAIESGDRVSIHALADIAPGCELFIDYDLVIDGEPTDQIRQQYACRCNSPGCRRTMLSASDG